MRASPAMRRVAAFAMLALPTILASCGGGLPLLPPSVPTLLVIGAEGAANDVWNAASGTPAACTTRVSLNGAIVLTFGGEVDASSLPQGGAATGSIRITSFPGGVPAHGTFAVVPDPALPPNNMRRVVFTPALPGDPLRPCDGGLSASTVYEIVVPGAGSPGPLLTINGQPLTTTAISCFETCGCPGGGLCPAPFLDHVSGAPYVVSTTPVTADPAPAAIDPCALGDTISIVVSEPLNPAGIDLTSVRVVNTGTSSQVPGTLVFHQAGTLPGLDTQSRIDYVVAGGHLTGNGTYQILIGPAVTDFGGNPVQAQQGNPAANLDFQTQAKPLIQHSIVEDFSTTANRDFATGLTWSGNGFLQATYPIELTGTGADGAFNPQSGTTVLDTNEIVGGVSRQGIWNFTSITIPAAVFVRVVGPWPAHLRCTGAVLISGTIDASAGLLGSSATNPWDRGAEPGHLNNNNGTHCYALGGTGNAGGGAGGTGSGVTPPAGSPANFGCNVRTIFGEAGFGPTIGGLPNTGTPPNPYYAAGQGGRSGCFPFTTPTPGCAVGDIGGLGGAGGSAGRIGEAGLPRQSGSPCNPITPPPAQPIAQPSPVAAAMMPPISVESGGSGGGGGGDHLDAIPTVPANDDQGAGGGGAGGAIRISSVGPYVQGGSGAIIAIGAQGGSGSTFGGSGGSGSGGEVWIQSFGTVLMSPTALINVTGPVRLLPSQGNIGCSTQAAGGGGPGLVQMEAGQGPTPTTGFVLTPPPTPTTGAVFSAPPFLYSNGVVTQTARSLFRFVASAPDYTGATAVTDLGNAAGAAILIRFEGVQEAVNSTPQNPVFDLSTLKTTATGGGPITASNLDELDGYAFIRFVVVITYPAPPATPSTATLPSVDSITIDYQIPGCP